MTVDNREIRISADAVRIFLTINIIYDLTEDILRNVGGGLFEYRLDIRKQPGIDSVVIEVALSLPAGAQLSSATPDGFTFLDGIAKWRGTLDTDKSLRVLFKVSKDGVSP